MLRLSLPLSWESLWCEFSASDLAPLVRRCSRLEDRDCCPPSPTTLFLLDRCLVPFKSTVISPQYPKLDHLPPVERFATSALTEDICVRGYKNKSLHRVAEKSLATRKEDGASSSPQEEQESVEGSFSASADQALSQSPHYSSAYA